MTIPQTQPTTMAYLLLGIVLWAGILNVDARTNSHSKSAHSHSHSDSRSISQGHCPEAGIVSALPHNGSKYHPTSSWPCEYIYENIDDEYGVDSYYPCVAPGGLTLAPTSVSMQLSTGGSNDDGWDWITLMIAYNFTHYNHLHPDGVQDCYNEPTPGPHNPPFLKWMQVFSTTTGCTRLCILEFSYIIECGVDFATAKSGEYHIDIPYVGQVGVNMSLCFKEKLQSDYASQCMQQLNSCPEYPAISSSDNAGTSPAPSAFLLLGLALISLFV